MFKNLFSKKKEVPNTIIKSPMNGTVVALENVKDEAFSQKVLGDGVAILSNDGMLYSPVDGEIMMVFQPSKHAVAVKATNGVEILMHIGLDTVKLDGSDFEVFVDDGASVKAGDKLIKFNMETLESKVPSMVTPIIITNMDEFPNVKVLASGEVSVGTDLIDLA